MFLVLYCIVSVSVWPSPTVSKAPIAIPSHKPRLYCIVVFVGVIQGILLRNFGLGVNRVHLSSLTCSLVRLVEVTYDGASVQSDGILGSFGEFVWVVRVVRSSTRTVRYMGI